MIQGSGSAFWLLKHELRLYWRAGLVRQMSSVFLVVALVLLHVVAAVVAFKLQDAPSMPPGPRLLMVTGLLGFFFATMLSRCLFLVLEALYTRRDTDLLLTSPLAPSAFTGARAMGIALTVTLEFAALLFPFADIFVIVGYVDWLKVYLLVPAFAILSASLALLIVLGTFQLLGARRTRKFARIVSTVVSIGFAALFIAPGLMPERSAQALGDLGRQAAVSGAALIWQPATLVLDGFAPTLIFSLACGALFAATVRVMGARFLSASLLSTGMTTSSRRAGSADTTRFRSDPHRILVSKEMRLIARNSSLILELMPQVGLAAPIAFTLWKLQFEGAPWAWLSVILVAGSCAGVLSWLIFTGEDAPDLLASSPTSRKAILRAKVEAALWPVLVLISVPLLVLLKPHPGFAVALFVCSAGCAASCAMLHVGGKSQRKPAGLNAHRKSAPGNGIVELLVVAGWMLVCAGMMWLT